MTGKKTLVIGASEHPWRYAFLAVNKLLQNGYEVIPVGKENGQSNGVVIETERKEFKDMYTGTLYINPAIQNDYYDYILNTIKPKRIIFNPGAENPEFETMARQKGIQTEDACTLVMLSTGQY